VASAIAWLYQRGKELIVHSSPLAVGSGEKPADQAASPSATLGYAAEVETGDFLRSRERAILAEMLPVCHLIVTFGCSSLGWAAGESPRGRTDFLLVARQGLLE
jgi:hypothetical protein